MGDLEDIMAKAEEFDMNNFEKERYELHVEEIGSLEKRVTFWRWVNIIFQVMFFWNIIAFAFEVGRDYSASYSPAMSSFFNSVMELTEGMTFWMGIITAFSFALMMYTGIIRGKWEGKLTRASAYALAFISNIEHRDYSDRMARHKQQLQHKKPIPRKSAEPK